MTPGSQKLARWTGTMLLVGGIAALTYAGVSWLETYFEQRRLQREFEDTVERRSVTGDETPAFEAPPPARPEPRAPLEPGSIVGRLKIDRVDVDVVVLEGTDDAVLDRGAGHITYTARPDEDGNIGVAAHRDTFFRGLRHIEEQDEILLTGADGRTRSYRVESTMVVEPTDVHVLDDPGYPVLTLVTCYPFDYIGSAPKRFIVHARRVDGA